MLLLYLYYYYLIIKPKILLVIGKSDTYLTQTKTKSYSGICLYYPLLSTLRLYIYIYQVSTKECQTDHTYIFVIIITKLLQYIKMQDKLRMAVGIMGTSLPQLSPINNLVAQSLF